MASKRKLPTPSPANAKRTKVVDTRTYVGQRMALVADKLPTVIAAVVTSFLKPDFKQAWDSKLHEIFGDSNKAIVHHLRLAKAIAMGSLVLSAVVGEYWPESDLDLYCEARDSYNLMQYLKGDPNIQLDHRCLGSASALPLVHEVLNYNVNGSHSVQLIVLNNVSWTRPWDPATLTSYLCEKCDFAFLRNWYNFYRDQVEFTDFEAIETKHCLFKGSLTSTFGSLFTRVPKYIARGFRFSFDWPKVLECLRVEALRTSSPYYGYKFALDTHLPNECLSEDCHISQAFASIGPEARISHRHASETLKSLKYFP